ncbi:MAG: gamma-glutamyl-gamma-aminobutyrate hydrolase [Alteromonadaceae bacterium]|uniref:Gamma-glutamyl-gamma-aminobutyrate hydrolase family protein n=1 Tax=Hydrocarboniclastica marina TaxID=2259620 RepID=A0A4P7XE52_9ALTE|nr:gamma-glutamyl-gamma-aminobutyrate hydrolase [Alteromonadaceae bacterium]QCF25199.1 gamma-glutamyl-gamma-aminobutyrate hydrolase family protein [Hydrocarboniclastica marina]
MTGSRRPLPDKPLIGVTGPDKGGRAAWWATRWALSRAGARACWIRPGQPRDIDGLDGLIIGGGADVSPHLYGEKQIEHVLEQARQASSLRKKLLTLVVFPLIFLFRIALSGHTSKTEDHARDELESRLIREAIARDLPVLGICRGAQLINVILGGSLHQQILDFYTESPQIRSVLPRKQVELLQGSRLEQILQCSCCHVNALHRQAIKEPGLGLQVVAREANGVIQAVENSQKQFLIGVQWHPEFMPQSEGQFSLFQALTRAARPAPKARESGPDLNKAGSRQR